MTCLSFPIPRRGGNSYQALAAERYFPDGLERTAISGVVAILHSLVVFHQQFTIFTAIPQAEAFDVPAAGFTPFFGVRQIRGGDFRASRAVAEFKAAG